MNKNRETTLVEYIQSSLVNDEYFSVSVYIETAKIKEYFYLKQNDNDNLNQILNKISSEQVIELIEIYGCYGIIIE